jgi:hypothetical protein
MYGVGYEPLGDLADFIDPFGLRKIPGNIKKKVDGYVESKAQRAASLAESHVEAGVRRAVSDAGKTAMIFGAGGILAGLVGLGVYTYRKHGKHNQGRRR